MRDEYWKRVWILQEVAMARNVCLVSGNISIDLDELWSIADKSMRLHDKDQSDMSFWDMDDPTMWGAYHLRKSGGRVPLWHIQYGFRGYKNSRDADKVYGLLGMVAANDDGTSPVENIHVDYDKPLTDIWLDVLFESPAPWLHLQKQIYELLRKIRMEPSADSKPDYETLLNYISSSRTSERHRELAKLAFRVCRALRALEEEDIILDESGTDGPPRSTYWLLIYGLELDFNLTIQQAAAMPGFLMQHGPKRTKHEELSGWRCAAHRYIGEVARGVVLDRRTAEGEAGITGSKPLMNRILKVCEQHSESCGGSVIIFEMPQICISMLIDTSNPNKGVMIEGTLRIQVEDLNGQSVGDVKGKMGDPEQ